MNKQRHYNGYKINIDYVIWHKNHKCFMVKFPIQLHPFYYKCGENCVIINKKAIVWIWKNLKSLFYVLFFFSYIYIDTHMCMVASSSSRFILQKCISVHCFLHFSFHMATFKALLSSIPAAEARIHLISENPILFKTINSIYYVCVINPSFGNQHWLIT